MATIKEIHEECIRHLMHAATQVKSVATEDNAMRPSLKKLIHALPHYKMPEWGSAYRETIANLLAANLPNHGIALPPNENISGYRSTVTVKYTHEGPYSSYRDVFFPGVNRTQAAAAVASAVLSVNGSLNDDWWGQYAVAALTDEIRRQNIPMNLNTQKLDSDLTAKQSAFVPALSASYLAVFESGYGPTMDALKTISDAGQSRAALLELAGIIQHQGFAAQISYMLDQQGLDNRDAVIWFLFNLWIAMKAIWLTEPDASFFISRFQAACPNYPVEIIGADNWWNGGYKSWHSSPLYGEVLGRVAKDGIVKPMPLTKTKETMSAASMFGSNFTPKEVSPHTIPNGYSQSFCSLGPLSWYKA
jgi:hypothetical protein